jgi:hypothetical protein
LGGEEGGGAEEVRRDGGLLMYDYLVGFDFKRDAYLGAWEFFSGLEAGYCINISRACMEA